MRKSDNASKRTETTEKSKITEATTEDWHDFWYNSDDIDFIRQHTEDNNDGP